MTQAEIAARVGLSQMQISRVIRRAIERMREVADQGSLRRIPGVVSARFSGRSFIDEGDIPGHEPTGAVEGVGSPAGDIARADTDARRLGRCGMRGAWASASAAQLDLQPHEVPVPDALEAPDLGLQREHVGVQLRVAEHRRAPRRRPEPHRDGSDPNGRRAPAARACSSSARSAGRVTKCQPPSPRCRQTSAVTSKRRAALSLTA